MSEQPAVFGKRGARPVPPAANPAPAEVSAAHLEVAAAARDAFQRRESPLAGGRGAAAVIAESREDADIRAYIGANWPKYRPLWQKMKPAPGLRSSGSLAAALFTSLWLLYRKQYRIAAAILAVQVAMTCFDLDWGWLIDIALAAFFGRYGKSLVLLGGVSTIARIRDAGFTPEIAAIRIACAGGGNPVAAMLGATVLVAAFGIGLMNERDTTIDDLDALRRITEQLRAAGSLLK